MKRLALVAAAIAFSVQLATSAQAEAQSVEDFYNGKTIRVLIGTAPGGGYDLYGRLFTKYIGKYIPGNPEVIAENMPGAGQYRAARYLETAAPKDGTVLLTVVQTVVVDDVSGGDARVDSSKLNWIGRLTSNVAVGAVWSQKGVGDIDDFRATEVIFGSTGVGDTTDLIPKMLNEYAGTNIRIISGYKGAAEMSPAMERGELDGYIGSWAAFKTRRAQLLEENKIDIVFQMAQSRHADLPDIPTIEELALSEDGKAAMRFLSSSAEIGRSVVGPPGMPEDRVAALREAFAKMLQDPDLIAEVEALGIDFIAASGVELERIAAETRAVPDATLSAINAALGAR